EKDVAVLLDAVRQLAGVRPDAGAVPQLAQQGGRDRPSLRLPPAHLTHATPHAFSQLVPRTGPLGGVEERAALGRRDSPTGGVFRIRRGSARTEDDAMRSSSAPPYALTPPAVNPCTRLFCMTRKSPPTGTEEMMDAAMRIGQWPGWMFPVMMFAATPTGIVRSASSLMNTSVNRYSFQDRMKPKRAAVTRPGAASGRTIRQRTPKCEAPSIIAASSSSTGSEWKKPRSSQRVKGTAKVAWARIRLSRVFWSP